jgi:AcrR family transcriptional regulator
MSPLRLHPRAPSTGATRRRSRRGEGEHLRQEIVDAAERLLIEAGDERDVSIRAIARAVGVTPPAVYLHFPDKEALIFAVCSKQFALFDTEIEAAAATATDPVDELQRRSRAYVDFGLAHREAYRIMFMSRPFGEDQQTEAVQGAGAFAFDHLVAFVRRGTESGAFRAVDPVQAAVGLWSAVHGVTSLLITLTAFPWPDVETMTELACAPHRAYLTAAPSD